MKEILAKLEEEINAASSRASTPEQTAYASGLADAYEIVKDYFERDYKIGTYYYVIVYNWQTGLNEVTRLKLQHTRKNKQGTIFYTFNNKDEITPSGMLNVTLSSKRSLFERVYRTAEEAEKNKDNIDLRDKVPTYLR